MAADLSIEERQHLWQQLTVCQQETILAFKKYQQESLFLTHNYLKGSHWQFVTVNENPYYHQPLHDDCKLFCMCGREVKYQYILLSETSGEHLALGSVHFSQHLGVQPAVALQVQQGRQTIDRGIDRLLLKKKKGLTFPHKHYRLLLSCQAVTDCSPHFLNRLQQWAQANLPLYDDDEAQLIAILKAEQRLTQPPKQNSRKPVKRAQTSELLAQLYRYLRKVEIGEALDNQMLQDTFCLTAPRLDYYLSFFTGSHYNLQLRKVNDAYYRIQ